MSRFFSNAERIEALQEAANLWLGTPFGGNSSSIGVGVSCQFLAAALYQEAGFAIDDPPEVPMGYAQFSRVSLLEPWADSHSQFESVGPDEIIIGDLLGFRLGRVVHHCGVVCGDGVFVHAIEGVGVAICPLSDATWRGRLRRVWRPIE